MPRLRLLSAGGPGPTTLSTHAAAGRARAEPRPGGAPSGLGQVGIRTQGQRSRREPAFSLVPVLRTFSVARAHPGREQGGDKQQIQGAARSPPPPGLAPSPRAQGPGRGCAVSLDRGSEGPRALVLSDPSSANAALVASLTRSPGSVCRHESAMFLPLGPAISRIQGKKMCSGAVRVCAAQGAREARRRARPAGRHICPLWVCPALLLAGVE